MMKSSRLINMAALALLTAACTTDDIATGQPDRGGEGIPFTATLSGKAATRAISENTTDKCHLPRHRYIGQ